MTPAASLVIPALLLPVAAVLALTLPASLGAAIYAAPLVVFGGGTVLALLIRRAQLIFGLVILALAHSALVDLGGRAVFDAVALLLPLNLGVIAWLGALTPLATRGAWWLGVTLVEAGVVVVVQRPELAPVAAALERPLVDISLGTWTALPQLALVAFVTALGLVVSRLLLDRRPLAVGAGWALIASFLALDAGRSGAAAGVHFATAGVLLLVGSAWEPQGTVHLDEVTGLPASIELTKALHGLPRHYALARVAVDDFLSFRSANGLVASHKMLRLVGKALRKVGGGGRAFFCGGHEFAVVFRRSSAKAAARHLDAVRRAIQGMTLDVSVPESPRPGLPARAAVERTVAVTISAGVAESAGHAANPYEVMQAAERALDRAKEAGLDRVSL